VSNIPPEPSLIFSFFHATFRRSLRAIEEDARGFETPLLCVSVGCDSIRLDKLDTRRRNRGCKKESMEHAGIPPRRRRKQGKRDIRECSNKASDKVTDSSPISIKSLQIPANPAAV